MPAVNDTKLLFLLAARKSPLGFSSVHMQAGCNTCTRIAALSASALNSYNAQQHSLPPNLCCTRGRGQNLERLACTGLPPGCGVRWPVAGHERAPPTIALGMCARSLVRPCSSVNLCTPYHRMRLNTTMMAPAGHSILPASHQLGMLCMAHIAPNGLRFKTASLQPPRAKSLPAAGLRCSETGGLARGNIWPQAGATRTW